MHPFVSRAFQPPVFARRGAALAVVLAVAAACTAVDAPVPAVGADAAATDTAASDGAAATDGLAVDAADATAADVAQADAGDADAVQPSGYAIGVLELTTAGAAGRTLPTTVWYPALAGSEGEPVKYLSGFVKSPQGARLGALPAKGSFPLVAFSHGNQGVRDQSFFLVEALVQAGYVVVAPDHVDNTFADFKQHLVGVMTLWRPQDLKAAIDRVLKPEANDPKWLADIIDESKMAVAGHSFGGYTALAVAGAQLDPPDGTLPDCKKAPAGDPMCTTLAKLGPPPWDFGDPRVDLVLPLAHALTAGFSKKSLKAMPVPVMLHAAQGDTTTTVAQEAKPAYAAIGGPRSLVVLQGGSHFSFANMCELIAFLPKELKSLCEPGAVPSLAESHAAVIHFALAACDVYLRGMDARRTVFKPGKSTVYPVEVFSDGVLKP